jgi:hypothetical protein
MKYDSERLAMHRDMPEGTAELLEPQMRAYSNLSLDAAPSARPSAGENSA